MELSDQDAAFKMYFNILGIIELENLAVKVQINQKKKIFEKKKRSEMSNFKKIYYRINNFSVAVQLKVHIGYFLDLSEQGTTFKTYSNILSIIKLEK